MTSSHRVDPPVTRVRVHKHDHGITVLSFPRSGKTCSTPEYFSGYHFMFSIFSQTSLAKEKRVSSLWPGKKWCSGQLVYLQIFARFFVSPGQTDLAKLYWTDYNQSTFDDHQPQHLLLQKFHSLIITRHPLHPMPPTHALSSSGTTLVTVWPWSLTPVSLPSIPWNCWKENYIFTWTLKQGI